MRAIHRTLNILTLITAVIAGVCVVVMMLHVTVDVLARLVGGRSLTGTIAFVVNYYMVIVVCLPLAFVERFDKHIAVDVLTDRLPGALRRHLRGWMNLLAAAVYGVLTYATWLEAESKYQRGSYAIENDLVLPIWYGYFTLPIGAAFLTMYLVLKFLAYLSGSPLETDRMLTNDDLKGHIYD